MVSSSASLVVVGILASLSLRKIAGENSAAVPHPDCTAGDIGTLLTCNAGNYSIPGNFDVSLVPQGIATVRLGSQLNTNSTTFRPERISTIHDNAPPLNITRLTQLSLYSFQGTNGTRLPIEAFLINVKGTLVILIVRGCRIGSIGPTFLQGFRKLRVLRLTANDISAIDISAFETRVSLSDAALPGVATIALEQNEISTLDWATFAPVAHSLRNLYLDQQQGTTGLSILTISKSFTFAALVDLQLQENAMSFPSRAILDTLNISTKSLIKLETNGFCPDEQKKTCSCCEARDFITWAHEIGDGTNAQKPKRLSFSCGNNAFVSDWEIAESQATLPPLDQYNDCAADNSTTTKRTLGTTTIRTTTTARTTKVTVDARSTSVLPGTRPTEPVESSSVPSGSSGSGWINRSAIGLYFGVALVVIIFLHYSL